MSYIEIELNALNMCPDVGDACGLTAAQVCHGLMKMWTYVFLEEKEVLTVAQIYGFMYGNKLAPETLVDFGLLEVKTDDSASYLVKGAKRLLSIRRARRAGGQAAKGYLIPGAFHRAKSLGSAEEIHGLQPKESISIIHGLQPKDSSAVAEGTMGCSRRGAEGPEEKGKERESERESERERKEERSKEEKREKAKEKAKEREKAKEESISLLPSASPPSKAQATSVAVPVLKILKNPEKPEALQSLWNTTANRALPRCRELGDARRQAARLALQRHALTYWLDIIATINATPFCLGQNDRGWLANFDWLLRPRTSSRVLEGAYQGKPPPTRGRASEYDKDWTRPPDWEVDENGEVVL
jgi:hypothetical protein